jgi:hypothetical protein
VVVRKRGGGREVCEELRVVRMLGWWGYEKDKDGRLVGKWGGKKDAKIMRKWGGKDARWLEK